MMKELITIEDGMIDVRGNPLFTDLYLRIYKSEILGIVFDNVSERKCLIELFRGERSLSGGKVFIENIRYDYDAALLFFRNNVAIIEKKTNLIDNLTIEENIFLFVDKSGMVSIRKYKNKFQTLINKFALDIDIKRHVRDLSVKERIIIELLKAYFEDKKLVVLIHISGLLLNNDMEDIHSLLQKLEKQGVSFAIIESFNSIVFEWVTRYFLIGNGKTSGIFDSNMYNSRQLKSVLAKSARPFSSADRNNKIQENGVYGDLPILEFKNIYTSHIKNMSIKVKQGEILRLVYMDDDSFEHIAALLKGDIKPLSGEITLSGRNVSIKSISDALDKGICFVEESPYENMLFYNMTVKDNLGLALSKKVPFFWFRKRYIKSLDQLIKSFHLEEFVDVNLRKLDPGILQVIAYLKWYLYAPHVVVCIKPFTELDISLQGITIEMILHLKSRGISVILLTSMLSETNKVEDDTVYIKDGNFIGKNEVYQTLYKR